MPLGRISFTALISMWGVSLSLAPNLPASASAPQALAQSRNNWNVEAQQQMLAWLNYPGLPKLSLKIGDQNHRTQTAEQILQSGVWSSVVGRKEDSSLSSPSPTGFDHTLQSVRSLILQDMSASLELDRQLQVLALQHTVARRDEQALTLVKAISYPYLRASTYATLAARYASLGQTDKSEELFAQSVQITQDFLSNEFQKPEKALLLAEIALRYTEAGQADQASNLFSQALNLGKSIQDRPDTYSVSILTKAIQNQATVLAEIAQRYAEAKQLPKSEEVFSLALMGIQQEKNANSKAETLVEIAQRYAQAGQPKQAAQVFSQAFQTAQTMDNGPAKAKVLTLIAAKQVKTRQIATEFKPIPATQDILAQAQQVANTISKNALKVLTLSNIAVAYAQAGQPENGLAILQSLKTDSDFDIVAQVGAWATIAAQYGAMGDEKNSVSVFSKALTTAETIKIRGAKAQALSSIAVQYAIARQIDRAIQVAKTIEIDQFQKQGIWEQVAVHAVTANHYEQALDIAKHASRLAQANELSTQGMGKFRNGEFQVALELMQNALNLYRQLQEPQGEKATLAILGDTYATLERYPKAIESYQQSLALAQTLRDREGEAEILTHLGYSLLQAGRYSEAIDRLREGIAIRQSVRSAGNYTTKTYGFSQKSAYEWLQTALIAQNLVGDALEVAEQSREGSLAELLATQLSDPRAQLRVNSLSLQQFQKIARERKATIVEYSILRKPSATLGQYWLLSAEPGTDDTTSPLPTSAILIWVIQPNGEVTVRRVDFQPFEQQQIRSMENLVALSRDSIGIRGLSVMSAVPPERIGQTTETESNQQLQQLHKLLIQPIADLLPKNPDAPVIIIPQDSLFLIPFPALQDASGKYLIEHHTLMSAPSIQILELTRQQRERVKGLPGEALIVGNPTMPLVRINGISSSSENANPQVQQANNTQPVRLVSLPAAELEAQTIAQLLGTQALIGNQAKETTVVQQMPHAKIIHFATHGLLDEFIRNITGVVKDGVEQVTDLDADEFTRIGEPGGIALAPGSSDVVAVRYPEGQEDGLLTSSEIQRLKLKSELVVLSACNTGGGTIIGDGVVGLSRAFIIAGVPSVIVSLWSVPDAPTAELMTEFYRQLQQNPDKAQALRNAMLATKAKYPNPKNWAAFTLIGER